MHRKSNLTGGIALAAAIGWALTGGVVPALAHEPAQDSGLKAEVLEWLDDAESKLLQLCDATPEEKFAWRPGEGVRSQGEVFLHVAAANYGLPAMWGVAPPEGFAFQGYEQSMSKKADVRAALEKSFAHMKSGLTGLSDAALAKEATVFGRKVSVRWGYLLLVSHAHEHLGQSIAYARTNGITPPWTAKEEEAAKAAEKKN